MDDIHELLAYCKIPSGESCLRIPWTSFLLSSCVECIYIPSVCPLNIYPSGLPKRALSKVWQYTLIRVLLYDLFNQYFIHTMQCLSCFLTVWQCVCLSQSKCSCEDNIMPLKCQLFQCSCRGSESYHTVNVLFLIFKRQLKINSHHSKNSYHPCHISGHLQQKGRRNGFFNNSALATRTIYRK